MYDWANSAFAVVILTAIFPVYYRTLAMDAGAAQETATAYWAYTTSLSLLLVAVLGPIAGAAADILAAKKRFLAVALGFGVVATASPQSTAATSGRPEGSVVSDRSHRTPRSTPYSSGSGSIDGVRVTDSVCGPCGCGLRATVYS